MPRAVLEGNVKNEDEIKTSASCEHVTYLVNKNSVLFAGMVPKTLRLNSSCKQKDTTMKKI
jgi:hypothetical protein